MEETKGVRRKAKARKKTFNHKVTKTQRKDQSTTRKEEEPDFGLKMRKIDPRRGTKYTKQGP
jgi:hypothetical protein